MKTLLFVFILFFSKLGVAQFKCVANPQSCINSNDEACRFVSNIWESIKEKEDQWARFLTYDFIDDRGVTYSSQKRFCRFRGYRGEVEGQVLVEIDADTSTHKKYRIFHNACGENGVIVENWEVHGSNLPVLSKKDLVFSLKRQFALSADETFKQIDFESHVGLYSSYPDNSIPFEPFRATTFMKYTTQRLQNIDDNGVENSEIRSWLNIFDKDLLYQNINLTQNTTEFRFASPGFPFYGIGHRAFFRFSRGPSLCRKDWVRLTNDNYLEIRPSKNTSKYGLTPEEFFSGCLQSELYQYRNEMNKILTARWEQVFPRFTSTNVNQNKRLEKEIKDIISLFESGDQNGGLDRVKKILVDVRAGRIRDSR